MKRINIFLLSCCLWTIAATAQPDLTLPAMRRVYQSNFQNPAFIPRYKTSVGIPVLSNFYLNNTRTGFTLKDVIDSKEGDMLNLNTFYEKLGKDGMGFVNTVNMDLFHVGVTINGISFGVHSTLKQQLSFNLSKEFLGFLVNGNAYFKGQTLDVNVLDVNSVSYVETGLSAAKQFGKLGIGVRGKFLQGIAAAQTKDLRFKITTPENNTDPLIVESSGEINTSGAPVLFGDSIQGQAITDDSKEFEASDLTSFDNTGFAIDLGVTYQVMPRLLVHGAVIDFGGINWKNNPYTYKLKDTKVQYIGFNDNQLNNGDAQDNYLDSLENLFGKPTITSESFRTRLRTRVLLGADYDITKKDRVGIMYQGINNPTRFMNALSFSYTRKFGVNWDVTGNYSIYNNSLSYVGLGTAVKMGAVQLYMLTDDVLIFMKPQTANTLYFRFGINLVWNSNKGANISSGEF